MVKGENKTIDSAILHGKCPQSCQRCHERAEGNSVCDQCFLYIIEQRVVKFLLQIGKKEALSQKMIKAGGRKWAQVWLITHMGDSLNEIITRDAYAAAGLKQMFNGRSVSETSRALCLPLSDAELARFARLHSSSYEPCADDMNDISEFIRAMEKRYPGSSAAAAAAIEIMRRCP
jgi:hypothetical protein